MIKIIDGYRTRGFKITGLKRVKNTVRGIILFNNRRIHVDYMNDFLRKFTHTLSLDLRDVYEKNVYYDIIDGEIIIHI
jgi:hypothetical protein